MSESSNTSPVNQASPMKTTAIVVGLIVLAVVGVGGYALLDATGALSAFSAPKVVPASGKVVWNGKPMEAGNIQTQIKGLRGAIGRIKKDGTFKLATDVGGRLKEGAYVGEHKVLVIDRVEQGGFGPGPLKTPEKYSDYSKTDLVLTIGSSGNTNIELKISGDAPPLPAGGGRGGGGPASGFPGASGGGGGRGGAPSAAASGPPPTSINRNSIQTIFLRYDKDNDGNLSMEEIAKTEKGVAEKLKAADEDKDGKVSFVEALQAVSDEQ